MPDDLSDEMLQDRIKALLEERSGVTDPDRLANIERELTRLGHEAAPPVKRAAKRPAARSGETR